MTMNKVLNKNTFLSVTLALIAVSIVLRIMPVSVDPVLKLVISKNKVSINNISQARNIDRSKEVMVDVLNIAEQNRFKHPALGELGYGDDFFVDVEAPFTVKQAGNFQFIVGSDDGFILTINGKQLCNYPGSRPLGNQTCRNINLTEGQHTFKLSYYQGYGHAGLQVQYKKAGPGKPYWVGENSDAISFD